MQSKFPLTILLVAAWTISIIHLFWATCAYLLTTCSIKPQHYDVVFVYLTYFYKQSCGPITLKQDTFFLSRDIQSGTYENETLSTVLFSFINDTLQRANLPIESNMTHRTEVYLSCLLISDLVWIVASFGLLVMASCKRERKFLELTVVGTWMVCSFFTIFLDVVSSVQYGLDMINIRSYTTWMEFMGINNTHNFLEYDTNPSSTIVPILPSTIVVSLLSRIFFVWLLNVISFFAVMFLTIPMIFSSENVQNQKRTITAEERIRNWQLFYGSLPKENNSK